MTTRHLADIGERADAYLGDRTEIATITREELQARLGRSDTILIDVRPLVEYEAGHIPGAIPVPPDRLDDLLDDLPADREIVAYCRGPYCVYADQAVRRLVARGRRAFRLQDGFPEWRRRGGAVDTRSLRRNSGTRID